MRDPRRNSPQFHLRSLFLLTTVVGCALFGWRQSHSLGAAIVWEVIFTGLVAWIVFRTRALRQISKISD
jgi:hypothetical protein